MGACWELITWTLRISHRRHESSCCLISPSMPSHCWLTAGDRQARDCNLYFQSLVITILFFPLQPCDYPAYDSKDKNVSATVLRKQALYLLFVVDNQCHVRFSFARRANAKLPFLSPTRDSGSRTTDLHCVCDRLLQVQVVRNVVVDLLVDLQAYLRKGSRDYDRSRVQPQSTGLGVVKEWLLC